MYKVPPKVGVWIRSSDDNLWYNHTMKNHCEVCIEGVFYKK